MLCPLESRSFLPVAFLPPANSPKLYKQCWLVLDRGVGLRLLDGKPRKKRLLSAAKLLLHPDDARQASVL